MVFDAMARGILEPVVERTRFAVLDGAAVYDWSGSPAIFERRIDEQQALDSSRISMEH